MKRTIIDLSVDGTSLKVAALGRKGALAPLVFLHGFGGSKEDYADVALLPEFSDRTILAFDAPGCGATQCSDLSVISIPFLRKTAERVIAKFTDDRFHLVGHSMGGLTALLLADVYGDKILSFTNIEGNLAPEDCFLSRQIFDFSADDDETYLSDFVDRLQGIAHHSIALYTANLPHKVRPGAVASIFRSMVDLSDNAPLIETFVKLPAPTMFMFGDQNRSLTYLSQLKSHGVEMAEIPQCGHFPMYANAPAMWAQIARFIESAERMKNCE